MDASNRQPEAKAPPLAFNDLAAQQERIKPLLDAAIADVLTRGQYILGPQVAELEAELTSFCGATRTDSKIRSAASAMRHLRPIAFRLAEHAHRDRHRAAQRILQRLPQHRLETRGKPWRSWPTSVVVPPTSITMASASPDR